MKFGSPFYFVEITSIVVTNNVSRVTMLKKVN